MQQPARHALLFLDRITLKPAEIEAFTQVAGLLTDIAEGRLVVQPAARPEPAAQEQAHDA